MHACAAVSQHAAAHGMVRPARPLIISSLSASLASHTHRHMHALHLGRLALQHFTPLHFHTQCFDQDRHTSRLSRLGWSLELFMCGAALELTGNPHGLGGLVGRMLANNTLDLKSFLVWMQQYKFRMCTLNPLKSLCFRGGFLCRCVGSTFPQRNRRR